MSKAANIYWDDRVAANAASRRRSSVRRPRTAHPKARRRTAPWWLRCLIVTSIFAMLLISINFRAFTEMQEEAVKNIQLSTRIQNLQDENLALQEEIHTLKTDPNVIKREARRLGVHLQQQVPVPAN